MSPETLHTLRALVREGYGTGRHAPAALDAATALLDRLARQPRTVAVSSTGRRVGADNPAAKLTREQADAIGALLDDREHNGLSVRRIAQMHGVSPSTVQGIASGRLWGTPPARYRSRYGAAGASYVEHEPPTPGP